jgi:putative oxidoreductase
MNKTNDATDLFGRVLLAAIFLVSGIGKISHYADTQGYMAANGVPGAALPLVIAVEVLGALAIIAGYRTRIAAALLAVFTLAAAFLFHNVPGDEVQQIMLLKNVAIAGGFLVLAARGAGDWSLDARAGRAAE